MRSLQIFLAAFVVRTATAVWVHQPGYMDSYYYYAVAESLFRGQGLVENFVWNYLSIPSGIPHESNLYWMPLSSVVMAVFFGLFGESFRAAQAPMILISAILPVISYLIAKDLLGKERYALGAAAFTIFSGPYFLYWTVPESFGLFAVFGSLSLYFTYRGIRDNTWYFIAAGAASGLAQLTRADGVLLALVMVLVGIRSISKARRLASCRSYVLIPASVATFILVQTPWLWRNYDAFGSVFPSSGLKAAFLREYNDLFAYGHALDLPYYLGAGSSEILSAKASALVQNFLTLDLIALVYLLPFVAIGWWQLRRREELIPVFAYTLLLYLSASLVFTYPGPRGTLLHAGAVVLPFLYAPAILGLDCAVAFIARFRLHWHVPSAQVNFTHMLVGFAAILSVALATRAVSGWDDHYRLYQQIAARLEPRAQPAETVMVVDPPAYYYVTRRPSVVFANDGLPELLDLARRFQVSYVVLEPAHPSPLHNFYEGKESDEALELEDTFPDKDGKLVKLYRVAPVYQ